MVFGQKIQNLKIIIDDWIQNNNLGEGDGWYSYTISLRIRIGFI